MAFDDVYRTPDERFANLPVMEVSEGGHFVQEWGEGIAQRAVEMLTE